MSYDDIVGVIYNSEVQAASFKAAKVAAPVQGFPLSKAELEGYFRKNAGLMVNYGRFCAKWRRPGDGILSLSGAMVESEHLKAIITGQEEGPRKRHDWRRNGPDIEPLNDNTPACEAAEYASDVSMRTASSSSSVHLRLDSDISMRTATSRSISEASTIRPNLAVIRAGKQRMEGERGGLPKDTGDEHFFGARTVASAFL